METLAAVLLYLEAINGDSNYTFAEIENIEDAHQQEVNAVYNDESELDYVETYYVDDVTVDDAADEVFTDVGPFTTEDGNDAY